MQVAISPHCDNENCLQTLPNIPWGEKLPYVRLPVIHGEQHKEANAVPLPLNFVGLGHSTFSYRGAGLLKNHRGGVNGSLSLMTQKAQREHSEI